MVNFSDMRWVARENINLEKLSSNLLISTVSSGFAASSELELQSFIWDGLAGLKLWRIILVQLPPERCLTNMPSTLATRYISQWTLD